MKTIRTSALALAACTALLSGYTLSTPAIAAPQGIVQPLKSPIPRPRLKGCVAKRALELKRFPNKNARSIGMIVAGAAVRVRGKVGGWTYVNGGGLSGWTKGGVSCGK